MIDLVGLSLIKIAPSYISTSHNTNLAIIFAFLLIIRWPAGSLILTIKSTILHIQYRFCTFISCLKLMLDSVKALIFLMSFIIYLFKVPHFFIAIVSNPHWGYAFCPTQLIFLNLIWWCLIALRIYFSWMSLNHSHFLLISSALLPPF